MPKREPNFEKLFQELEATIEQLEAGNLTLDQALALYEQGISVARQCSDLLDRAELRIQELDPAAATNDQHLDEFESLTDESPGEQEP
jgi:exodeoxyribonuclease VII small subunit